LDEATAQTVDDLVADDEDNESSVEDEPQDVRAQQAADPFIGPSAPPFPPGFGFGFGYSPQRVLPMQFVPSSADTSFGQPGMQPPPGMGINLPIGPPLPAIPLNPATPSFPSFAFGRQPPMGPSSALSAAGPGSEAKRSIKALAVESGLSKDIAAQSSKSQQLKKVLQDEDFPALGGAKSSVAGSASSSAVHSKPAITKPVTTPSLKKSGGEPSTSAILSKPGTPLLERKLVPPAILTAVDTAVKPPAGKAADMVSSDPAELEAAFPALPTPHTASSNNAPAATSAARPAPKTLRVLPTPKIEQTAAFPPVSAIRAGSVSTHRPDTPISEIISDSASIVSASVSASRTNSPPPTLSKIGTAPVRATTKSQQRKQRKEASTSKTQPPATTSAVSVATPQPKNEPEVVAPIIGRKKKQKKEKTTSSTAEATPDSRSESRSETPVPTPAAVPAPSAAVKEDLSTYRHVAGETTSLTETASPVAGTPVERLTPVKTRVAPIANNVQDTVESTGKGQDSPSAASFKEKDANGEISLEALFRDLLSNGEIPELSKLAFLKPGSATSMYHQKSHSQSHAHPPPHPQHNNYLSAGGNGTSLESFSNPRPVMTEADRAALHAGKPVRKTIDGMRVLLTPNGDCVRDLTEEEEDRYLKLQADVARDMDTPAEFFSERYGASGGFSLIKGRAVPNGRPTYFPNGGMAGHPAASGATLDPLAKMQREDAITYINQYVLPRLNLGNANFGIPGSWMGSNDLNRPVPPVGSSIGAMGHNMAEPSFPVTADSAGTLTTSARSEVLPGFDAASLGLPPYNPYGPGTEGQFGYGPATGNRYGATDSPTTAFGGGNHPYSTADELASMISLPGGALDQLTSFPVNTGMPLEPDPASTPSNLAAMLQSASENMFKAAGEGIVRDHLMAAARAAEASGRSLDGVTTADISVTASMDQPGMLSGSLPPTLTVSDKAPDSLRDILKPLGLDGTSSPFVKNDKGEWTVDEKIVRELAGKLMQQAHQTILPGSGAIANGGNAPLGPVTSDIAATVRESAAVQAAIEAAKAEVTHAATALSGAGAPDIAAIIHKDLGGPRSTTAAVTATAMTTMQAPAPPHTTGPRPATSAPAPGTHSLSIPGGDLFGYVPPMGLEEAEAALTAARRESESLDKKLVALIKKNRRLLLAGGN
jgi:hypothetical protein